jgi:hypothetical protein
MRQTAALRKVGVSCSDIKGTGFAGLTGEVRSRGERQAAPKTQEKVKRKPLHNDFLVVI